MRRVYLVTSDGLQLVGWLGRRSPDDVRLIQAYDPRDQGSSGLRRQVFFVRHGDALSFVQTDCYGLVSEAEVPQ